LVSIDRRAAALMRSRNHPMLFLRWSIRLLRDVVMFGIVNRSLAMSFWILFFLGIGLVIAAAQVSAPFIYTLF
jgi:hypothetical protein